jgi:protein-L-isoaspartate(D-aspartate) O-methyltransferase
MGSPLSTLLVALLLLLLVGLGYALMRTRPASARDWEAERARMVEAQIEARGVKDPRVLEAMRTVPRHRFVPEAYRARAYEDRPLPIGEGQTISQPYMVAVMTELLELEPDDRVLEIGTGSGYQAAVLSELVDAVYSIEIVPELAERARKLLAADGYDDVVVITGDGYKGLTEHAPFDAIIVTAAPEKVPQPLLEQLAVGGSLVIPVGGRSQWLKVLERTEAGFETKTMFQVRFVPMTGEAQTRD